ncbi:hypothetical protein GCM10011497_05850 [Elstera cyanobacteriorum]|uniref:UDP-2,3-diacylglucosamine pyrophosphatase n=1 Tax=Elstera cyanobacteriorum TaxID=2022747 RepID=A0A255XPZ2_9PROT|nr:UDP-2,3-diacylglucosamine diphosphatase LpxI [Elstera cyanobacteriorum]OYQ18434.1 UDP-2,3-diacylglucosamine pyrophosphatase [Elstera cyanobacteriorum]GFZ80294.1 hypothetical protein GCM10011497_05850 [Elstera cyanobacteriorum]
MTGSARLGIIAGGGALPREIIAACRTRGQAVYLLALDGQTDPETTTLAPHSWHRLGGAGEIFDRLRAEGVREVVFAGKVKRPSLLSLTPDARGAAFLARIGFRALGDDGLLRAVAEEFEREGFVLRAVPEVLAAPGIPLGPLGIHRPDTTAEADIARGIAVLRALDPVDVGQAVVVQQGMVLAVEAIEGTDAMIARAGQLKRPGGGGVLVKLAKTGQDKRLDLPGLGPETVAAVAAAGLVGLAFDAQHTTLIDRAETVARADAAGLFLVGMPTP